MSRTFKVSDCMVKYPYTVEKNMSLAAADEFMSKCSIRHLPVVDGENLVGVVSDRDIRSMDVRNYAAIACVEDVMSRNVFVVDKDSKLSRVLDAMASKKYGSVLVRDENHDILGIFTTTDALKMLSELIQEDEEKDIKIYLNDVENYQYADFA